MRRAVARGVAGMLGATVAWPAHAHLVETGFGGFYDGIAHVVLTASDLLVVVSLALLAGQRGTQAARWSLFVLPAAWFVAGIVGAMRGEAGATLPVLTTLSFGVAGALAALGARLPPAAVAAYAAVAGGVHGYVNGATLAPGGASALVLAGAAAAAFCVLALTSAQVTALRPGWPRIAVRVAGSWLGAAALLMIGWQARLSG
ncbi:MAG: HupE/UreJ family protein [Burkholderiaceae bacterium]